MISSLLVANRGEIASRIIASARRLGVRTVAIYSEVDADLPYVRQADEAVLLGPAAPAQSYLDTAAVLDVARRTNTGAVHPGYGFLSENALFARQVVDAGMTWVGPAPGCIEQVGDKINARALMQEAGLPVLPGSEAPVADAGVAVAEAARIGYPLIVKASAGGGGIGMGIAWDEEGLRKAFSTARSSAERYFGSPAVLLERYLPRARHVEVQIFGLPDGRVVALGDRDCSVQRRYQKVVEETPSPGVAPALRAKMLEGAARAGEAVGYRGAGTVECLVDPDVQEFYFCEMNARLQVEHPITEQVTGIDLVEQQLRVAAGENVSFDPDDVRLSGHAIELRVYAEDPERFLPCPGTITRWDEPVGEGVRVDAGYASGVTVTSHYDPLLAKLCVLADERDAALSRAREAARTFRIEGPKTNLPFLVDLLEHPPFVKGDYDVGIVGELSNPGSPR